MGDYQIILQSIVSLWQGFILWISLMPKENIGNFLLYSAGFIWGVELIPQLRQTYKTKNVKGINLSFFAASLTAYFLYMTGSSILGNWNIVIAHIPSLFLTLWMTILIIKYKEKK